ncbi:MAG: FAD-binding domain, partial [Gemmatimonadales bacterium]
MRIAINGIGIAGPTLAWWLRHYGHEPVLYERAPALRTGGYLIDFWGLGYEIAERMGIIGTVRDRAYEVRRMDMVDANGRVEASVDLQPARDAMEGRYISIARSELGSALFTACDGIPAHFGVSITEMTDADDGATVTLSDGSHERYDLVVGADGLHSRIRKAAFGDGQQFEEFLDCCVAAFEVAGYPQRDDLVYVSHTEVNRHAARMSLRNDRTLVLFVWRSERLADDLPLDARKAAVRGAFESMGWEAPVLLDAMDA